MTLSASALSRAEQCVWWVKNVPDETEKVGDSATRGTLFHDHMEKCFEKMQDFPLSPSNRAKPNTSSGLRSLAKTYLNTQRSRLNAEKDDANDPDHLNLIALKGEALTMAEGAVGDVVSVGVCGPRVEAPVAIDMSQGTARFLPRGEHRDYSDIDPEREIPMTVDLFWITQCSTNTNLNGEDVLYVRDWKTGRPEYTDSVKTKEGEPGNAQLHACGAAVWLALDDERDSRGGDRAPEWIMLEIAFVDEYGKVRIDSAIFRARHLVATYFARFSPVWDSLKAEDISPVVGPKCRWCRSASICPEAESLSATSASSGLVTIKKKLKKTYSGADFVTVVRDEDHAVWLKSAISVVETHVKAVRASLESFSTENGGIPMGGGKVWREISMSSDSIDLSVKDDFGDCCEEVIFDDWEIDKVAPRKNPAVSAIKKALGTERANEIKERAKKMGALKTRAYSQFRTTKEKS